MTERDKERARQRLILETNCPHCKLSFRKKSIGGHVIHCKMNPNKTETHKSNWHKWSDERKGNFKEQRKEFLEKNPELVPYRRNHSSKESYPERLFREALEKEKIEGWVQEFQAGRYSYDFAFPTEKIDIEIDGGTHSSEKVKLIDKERDEYSQNEGWKVVRFSAEEVKADVLQCIEKVKRLVYRSNG